MEEIMYKQVGDVLLPDFTVTEEVPETRPILKYGSQREDFIKEKKKGFYRNLQLHGTLKKYLADIQEEPGEMERTLMNQMLEKDTPPDKAKDQMGWVRHVQMTQMLAEEIVMNELIFAE